MNNKNNKIKKALKGTLALMAVAGLTIGATLALLNEETEQRTNTFTPGGDIELILEEPNWEQNGEASHFAPGSVIPKDPTVGVPASSSENEYIAATVKYYADLNGDKKYTSDEEVNYEEFTSKYAKIYYVNKEEVTADSATHNNEWFTDNNELYYYVNSQNVDDLKVMIKGNKSVIFDKVVVNKDIPTYAKDTDGYKAGTPVAFKIDVKAYGVQDSVGKVTAKEAIKLMIDGKDPNTLF